jgi:hypothetical protein
METCVVWKKKRALAGRFGAACLLAVAAGLAFMACDDGPSEPPPGPGDLIVSLVSPNGDEGAAVFEAADDEIGDLDCEECDLFERRADGRIRIVVLMDMSGVVRFTMGVDDRRSPPELQIVEVADGSNRLRDDLSGYAIALGW